MFAEPEEAEPQAGAPSGFTRRGWRKTAPPLSPNPDDDFAEPDSPDPDSPLADDCAPFAADDARGCYTLGEAFAKGRYGMGDVYHRQRRNLHCRHIWRRRGQGARCSAKRHLRSGRCRLLSTATGQVDSDLAVGRRGPRRGRGRGRLLTRRGARLALRRARAWRLPWLLTVAADAARRIR